MLRSLLNKKAQASFEFLILIGTLTIVLVGVVVVAEQEYQRYQQVKTTADLTEQLTILQREQQYGLLAGDGYSHDFALPIKANAEDYTIALSLGETKQLELNSKLLTYPIRVNVPYNTTMVYSPTQENSILKAKIVNKDNKLTFTLPDYFAPRDQSQTGQGADIDGDGNPDLLFWDSVNKKIEVWFLDKNMQRIDPSKTYEHYFDPQHNRYLETPIALADFNNDGKAELLTKTSANALQYRTLSKDATGSTLLVGEPATFASLSQYPGYKLAGLYDANNDNIPDLIFYKTETAGQVPLLLKLRVITVPTTGNPSQNVEFAFNAPVQNPTDQINISRITTMNGKFTFIATLNKKNDPQIYNIWIKQMNLNRETMQNFMLMPSQDFVQMPVPAPIHRIYTSRDGFHILLRAISTPVQNQWFVLKNKGDNDWEFQKGSAPIASDRLPIFMENGILNNDKSTYIRLLWENQREQIGNFLQMDSMTWQNTPKEETITKDEKKVTSYDQGLIQGKYLPCLYSEDCD